MNEKIVLGAYIIVFAAIECSSVFNELWNEHLSNGADTTTHNIMKMSSKMVAFLGCCWVDCTIDDDEID